MKEGIVSTGPTVASMGGRGKTSGNVELTGFEFESLGTKRHNNVGGKKKGPGKLLLKKKKRIRIPKIKEDKEAQMKRYRGLTAHRFRRQSEQPIQFGGMKRLQHGKRIQSEDQRGQEVDTFRKRESAYLVVEYAGTRQRNCPQKGNLEETGEKKRPHTGEFQAQNFTKGKPSRHRRTEWGKKRKGRLRPTKTANSVNDTEVEGAWRNHSPQHAEQKKKKGKETSTV